MAFDAVPDPTLTDAKPSPFLLAIRASLAANPDQPRAPGRAGLGLDRGVLGLDGVRRPYGAPGLDLRGAA